MSELADSAQGPSDESSESEGVVSQQTEQIDTSHTSDNVNSDKPRMSPRIRITTLTAEIAESSTKLDEYYDFVEAVEADVESADVTAINSRLNDLEQAVSQLTGCFEQLKELTNKTEQLQTPEQMVLYFTTESVKIDSGLRKVLQDKEILTQNQETELREEEVLLEAAKKDLEEKLAKFSLMKARRDAKERQRREDALSTSSSSLGSRTPSSIRHTSEIQVETLSETGVIHQRQSFRPKEQNEVGAVQELAASLVSAMKSTRKNAIEPCVFSGDTLEFQDWCIDFESYVDSEGFSNNEALRYLKRKVQGKAKSAVAGQLMSTTGESYSSAMKVLKERFGNRFSTGRALRQKLDSWPKISTYTPDALREFADYLLHLNGAMKGIPELQSLNDMLENEKMTSKLPDHMITKWAEKVKNKRVYEQSYPTFAEFVSFVDGQAEVLSEPLMLLRGNNSQSNRTQNQNKAQQQPARTARVHVASTEKICGYCQRNGHELSICRQFEGLPYEQRETHVRDNWLCWGCLTPGHGTRQCQQRKMCTKCSKPHPTSLHRPPRPYTGSQSASKSPSETASTPQTKQSSPTAPNSAPLVPAATGEPTEVTPESENKTVTVKATCVTGSVLNMVLPVYVSTTCSSKEILVYALIDTQSDASFVCGNVVDILNPQRTKELVTMRTLNNETEEMVDLFKNLTIRGYHSQETLNLQAYRWVNISCERSEIPNNINVGQIDHLREIVEELPPPLDAPVAMLVGRDCIDAFAPLQTIHAGKGKPFATKTVLGWLVMAPRKAAGQQVLSTKLNSFKTTCILPPNEEEDVMLSQQDLQFISTMETCTERRDDGSYQMPLPFKSGRPALPDNRKQAESRLTSLLHKFDKDPAYKQQYSQFKNDLFTNGHAEEVTHLCARSGEVWYIPHFAVKHPKKDKLRVVFDCSAMFKNTSINDHLLQGPDLMNSLIGILCRFRKEPVAIACDIEKMFYNFYVDEEDRDYLRFLWADKDGTVKEYRMTVHLFGAVSSPSVATYGLRKIAADQKENFPAAANFVYRDFYVDDGVTSVSSKEEAIELIQGAISLCKTGNLRLHKFICNSPEVMSVIPNSEVTEHQQLFEAAQPTHRTLGMEWSVATDTLRFTSHLDSKPPTRRGILSVVAQLYDPLGFLAPFNLQGKNILQKVNNLSLDWDEIVPDHLQQEWQRWLYEVGELDRIVIPRCYKPSDFGKVTRTELHHFADASFKGIGACSYIRLFNAQSQIHSSLVMAKSRVVPSKGKVTIPRLELQGALMTTQLSKTVKKELDLEIDEEHFWTDSEIALGYISNDAKRFHVFVANRIHEIREASEVSQWHHIPGDINPADIASRGLEVSKLYNSPWFQGPKFLQERDLSSVIEKRCLDTEVPMDDPEVKRMKTVNSTRLEERSPIYKLSQHFSSYTKFKRVVASLQEIVREKPWKTKAKWEPQLDACRLAAAEKQIIKDTQNEHYNSEIQALLSTASVGRRSNLLKLHPVLDQEGILRIGGRAQKSSAISFLEKHPIILPKDSPLAQLLVREIHEHSHHRGRSHTLTAIREKGFWVVSCARLVKTAIQRCITCKALKGYAEGQKMGELPAPRLENTAPFSNVGIDCFGPFLVKERRTELKRYGLIFTCLYSRAVHVEILDDMTTDCFLNALRCFIALRGAVSSIYCDNGTNFVGGKNELTKSLIEMADGSAKQYSAEKQIKFVTSTPSASHQGGVWERQIRSIRSVLNEIFRTRPGRMDSSMLRTAFYEAMATVNSRPLSLLDLNNPETLPLTPNCLINGKPEPTNAPPGVFSEAEYSQKRWKRVQAISEEFWRKWRDGYYKDITARQTWKEDHENLKVGDVVLVMDKDLPRNHWKLGIVDQVHPGDDGLVRKATVRLANCWLDNRGKQLAAATLLQRPVQKLILLVKKQRLTAKLCILVAF